MIGELIDFTDLDCPAARTEIPTIADAHPIMGVADESVLFCFHDEDGERIAAAMVPTEVFTDANGEVLSEDEGKPKIIAIAQRHMAAPFN